LLFFRRLFQFGKVTTIWICFGREREQANEQTKNKSPWRRLAGAVFFSVLLFCDTSGWQRISGFYAFKNKNTFWFLLCKQTQDTKKSYILSPEKAQKRI
jgi:hypothetical protein